MGKTCPIFEWRGVLRFAQNDTTETRAKAGAKAPHLLTTADMGHLPSVGYWANRRPFGRWARGYNFGMAHVVHTACPHDCPDACSVLVTIEDGRATKIAGNPDHPVTRGFLCGKVAKYLDRVYSPDRLLYPMRRSCAKGQGQRSGGVSSGSDGTRRWGRLRRS